MNQISGDLRFFRRQSNAYNFLCPYCQNGTKDKKGKPYAPSDGKGYFYKKFRTWNFICHLSGCHSRTQKTDGKTFEKFLADHFPKQHLEYVRRRDELGLTGYQTNCPTLGTVLKSKDILGNQPPQFGSHPRKPKNSPQKKISTASSPNCPRITTLPPIRSPQQQAGQQSHLNYLMKQREQRRRERQGW